jgi:hypothetical protein
LVVVVVQAQTAIILCFQLLLLLAVEAAERQVHQIMLEIAAGPAAAVEVRQMMRLVLEILHQLPHHKETVVELVQIGAAVVVEHLLLAAHKIPHQMLVMGVLVQRQQFLVHP